MSGEGRYRVISLEQRQQIVEILKSYEEKGLKPNYSAVARQFSVSPRTITRIRESKENWLLKFKEAGSLPSLAKRKKLPVLNCVDESLYLWYRQRIDAGEFVTGVELKEKALNLNDELQGSPSFKASEGWLTRFKSRYQIGPILKGSQKVPSDFEICKKFLANFTTLVEETCFKHYQIYNVDETSLIWRSMPGNVLEGYFQSEEDFDQSKERVIIITCCNASGSHKVPLFIIGDSKNLKRFKNSFNQIPVTYVVSKNGEMTNEVFQLWYTQHFLPSVRSYQLERNQFYKVLLLMNSATCRMLKDEINSIDGTSIVEFIPSKVIQKLQPMRHGVVGKMKKLYRISFLRELLLEKNVESVLEFIRKRNMKTFSVQIASAWNDITVIDIRKSWRKIIPDIEFGNTSKDDISVTDLVPILYRVPGFDSCTSEDVEEWFQNDNKHLEIAEDPLQIVKEEVDCLQEWADDVEPKENSFKDAEEALEALIKYKKWFERRGECESEHLMTLQKLSELSKDIVSHMSLDGSLCSFVKDE